MNGAGNPVQGHDDKRRAIERGNRAHSPADQKIDLDKIRPHALELSGASERQYDGLLHHIGEAEVVMIGEATHGTHEFYEERAKITTRLVEEKGFTMVVCEADLVDMEHVDRYIRSASRAETAAAALAGFRRYPLWIFRNTAVADFVEWAKQHNEKVTSEDKPSRRAVSLHGFDLQGLYKSLEAVIQYLEKRDPKVAKLARQRYAGFAEFAPDPHDYGLGTSAGGGSPSCQHDCARMLAELRALGPETSAPEGDARERHRCQDDDYFYALQNAVVVEQAEAYYRTLYESYEGAWNVRDRHMFTALVALKDHCEALCERTCKVVVWAHNCHVSDARMTEIAWDWGQINLGQLVKEKYGDRAFSIAFGTYCGTLTAAPAWGESGRRVQLPPAMAGSQEDLFHQMSLPRFLLDPSRAEPQDLELMKRSIGLVYREDSEETYNYYRVKVFKQYNRIIFIDETRAVEPLDEESVSNRIGKDDEMPQTYPLGV